MQDLTGFDELMQFYRNNYTMHFQVFSTDLRPVVKNDGAWWEKEGEYVSIGQDKEYTEFQKELQGIMLEAVGEVRPKVESMKQKIKEQSEQIVK